MCNCPLNVGFNLLEIIPYICKLYKLSMVRPRINHKHKYCGLGKCTIFTKKITKESRTIWLLIFRFCANMIVFSEVGGLGAVVECSPIWISLYYCESWCCNISKSALVTCRLQSLPSFGKLTQYAVLTNASQQSYGFNLLVTKYI